MKKLMGFAIGLLAGCMVMIAMPSFANTVKQYILVDPTYPIYVNGSPYESIDLPIMNYQGSTYVPMKAVGDLLGAAVQWNDESKRAEITFGSDHSRENTAFRNIKVTGTNGNYQVNGEARVFEAVMNYAVSDGHNYLLDKAYTLAAGAPEWSAFTLNIQITQEQQPINGTLTLELYEKSAKDGSQINILIVPLESFQ